LTEAISIGIDVHFLIEQAGRYAAGCFQNFNGSGGILRTKALRQAGGWQSDTLAEDLDASYRIQIQGFQILYLRDLYCPGEVPPTVPSFKKQQGRWACGSLQTAKKLLPILLSNRNFGIKQRLEAFIHLTGYLVHPLMFTSFLLACLATLLRVDVFHIDSMITTLRSSVHNGALGTTVSLSPRYLFWGLAGLLIVLCTIAA
jgi:cellulose synthase/poly-beta-1,6-N-acetylglucosamine synthase-like glycosyltransferase